MEFPKRGCLAFFLLAAIAAITLVLFIGCGKRVAGPLQVLNPDAPQAPIASEETTRTDGELPSVWDLDRLCGGAKSVREGATVVSLGADYTGDESGTTTGREYAIEASGTALKLRAYSPGEYSYALYAQDLGGSSDPLKTLIDSEVCDYGGGRDDDVPLIYYIGLADYTIGSWRWFGPYADVDVELQVNSEALKSTFTSNSGNFYLTVLVASTGGRTTSSLPSEGLVAPLPIDPTLRAVSQDEEDPVGVQIEVIQTDTEEGLETAPVMVTGLRGTPTQAGVLLEWDKNADPDVFLYQVLRDNLDDEDPMELIGSVNAPAVEYTDATGTPGVLYAYKVRAFKAPGLLGGGMIVNAARLLAAPTVTASDGQFGSFIRVAWTEVDGATGYEVYRTDTSDPPGADAEPLAALAVGTLQYDDADTALGLPYWYWVRAQGEDINGPLGGPDRGLRVTLDPGSCLASDGDYPDRVEIIWGADPLAEYYRVYRAEDEAGTGLELVGEAYAPETTFSDTLVIGCPWNEVRWYSIARVIASVEQPRGLVDSGYRGLAAPANVAASDGTYAMRISVSWNAVNNATRYKVYRATTPDDPTPTEIAEVDAPQTSYDDSPGGWGTTEGLHYYYFVAALWGGPDTERSAYGGPDAGWRALGTPTGVTASDGTYTNKVTVTWSSVANATGYRIYRDGGGSPIGEVTTPTALYNDMSVQLETEYYYEASAFVPAGEGPRSLPDTGYAHNEPPVASLSADPTEGDAPLTVDFDASTSSDPDGTIDKYEWDWENDGSWDFDSGTDPTVQHVYISSGEYTCAVRVTDDFDAADTASATVKAWQWKTLTVDSPGYPGYATSLAKVNGNPAISYCEAINGDLKYVRASDASGSSWGGPIILDSVGDIDASTSLAIVNGNPAISYHDGTNGDLKYIRATDANGSSWGSPVTLDSDGDVGHNISLAVVNGNPAISYYHSTNWDLKYVRASDASGSSWGTPVVLDAVGGQHTSLAVVNGNPAIGYYASGPGDLKYIRANDADGASWNSPLTVHGGEADVGAYPSLAVVSGYPAITYRANGNTNLTYVRASDANGSSWGSPITLDSDGNVGKYTCLRLINGIPAVSYYDYTNANLKYIRASDANGSSWVSAVTIDSVGNVGEYTSLCDIDGNPAISYFDDTNNDLKYAYYTTDP